ncbi:VWA domain-containing protein [Tautonia plasticadhaerens]|uniref:von Willebrand factor type A domain protein n=1 Tax=Tautonia plasticadhaerens TaxID=2527974 RepID=A0A518HB20_9BACT|nr:VWA domain-containing protein [Tautonia plasticadhaerens]QDV38053.1 von Willebrand factor type A domain protein [Tautonia plasticadhaerens]
MRLAEPYWLLLLVLLPIPWLADRARPRIRWPSLGLFPPRGWKAGGSGWASHASTAIRTAAIGCVVLAMARPQTVAGKTRIRSQGVAIVVAVDQSFTMTAEDIPGEGGASISRLEAARRTVDRFILGRPDDLIGLVTFATYPDLACPPTLDHEALRALVAGVEPARPGENATNIGDAIAWSLQAALGAEADRRAIILLTDGQNQPDASATPDWLEPDEAARLVRRLGARLYAIGLGAPGGTVRIGVPGTDISYPETLREGYDPEALVRWADLGGGKAFGAEDSEALDRVFDRINALETSPITGEILTRYQEEFPPLVVAALALLSIDRLTAALRPKLP